MSKVRYGGDPKGEWDTRTSVIVPHKAKEPFFYELIGKYMPSGSKAKKCIELGAIPGNYLIFFNKAYGYSITGVDFSSNSKAFEDTMRINGIRDYKFISADVMDWSTKDRFDLVTSFGFIEHFDDLEGVLKKHIEVMNKEGLLLVTVPNFRYIQWLYHMIFDQKNLHIHNIDAMRPKVIHNYLASNGLRREFVGVIGKTEFWYEDKWNNGLLRTFREKVTRILNKLFANTKANRFTAPYLVYIYKRK